VQAGLLNRHANGHQTSARDTPQIAILGVSGYKRNAAAHNISMEKQSHFTVLRRSLNRPATKFPSIPVAAAALFTYPMEEDENPNA
jgi:hypothetical protein